MAVLATQVTSPWIVAPNNSSLFSLQAAGSILSVTHPAGSVTTVISTNPAGSIQSVTFPAGSTVAVLATQVTSPWIVAPNNTSIVGTFQEETVGGPSIKGIALVWESNANTSVMSTVSPTNPLRISGSISGRVEATQPAGSIMTVVNPAASITSVTNPAGSITAVSGATTTTAGSIISIATPAGSVLAVRTDNASVITTQIAGSIMAVNATQPAGSLLSAIQVAGSVMAVSATQGTTPWVVNFQNSSILSVPVGSTIALLQSPSIVGSYAEDAAHTTADKGIFTLMVRNDTLSSITSNDTDYSPHVVDAIGRTITKPFAGEDATIISYVQAPLSQEA
jgi:hypothetical protein